MQRMLTQSRVVLHDLQALCCIALVFGGRVIILTVHGAHDSDNFSGFGFLGHYRSSFIAVELRSLAGQPENYDQPETTNARESTPSAGLNLYKTN